MDENIVPICPRCERELESSCTSDGEIRCVVLGCPEAYCGYALVLERAARNDSLSSITRAAS